MNEKIKRSFISGALVTALLFSCASESIGSVDINTASGTIDAQFSLFNISAYPLSFKYNPEISKGSVGSKWETSLDANLQLSDDVPIFTVTAYCSKFLFIKNENGKFESGGGLGSKFEFINGDYTLTSNIGEKLTFDDKGNLKTIQDESGNTSVINRNSSDFISGWDTKSDRIKTFSIDSALSGKTFASNENAKVERNSAGQITSIKADRQFDFIYKNSLLSEILVNGISRYAFHYDKKGLLSRLKEPEHDYALSYYKDDKIQSIDDARGDSIYVEYDSDTAKAPDTQFVYVWNMTQFLRTQYKYTKDTVEITEGPIDSDDFLFGTIDRKTGIRTSKSIKGDKLEIVPGKEGNFVVNTSLRGFTPYQIQYSFNNLVLKNKNGIEYFKDLLSPSDFTTEKILSEIKDEGVIRDLNKNITGMIFNGIEKMKYTYSKDGSLMEKITTASGNEIFMTYDKEGRIIRIADSLGNKTSYRYSQNSTDIIYPNGTQTKIVYDENSLPSEILDPLGRKTLIQYQNTLIPQSVELCNFDTQSYNESQDDGLYSVSSNLFGTWLFIDNEDLTISRISPSGTITNYDLDKNNQILTIMDSEDRKIVRYSYDKYLQLIDASTDSCRLKFDYDDYGRLARKTYEKELSIDFDYDKKDAIRTVTDSSGLSLQYIRDANGKLVAISSDKTGTFKISYYDSGLKRDITYPNGVVLKWVYDKEDKITQYSILLPDGTARSAKLDYDKIGNIIKIDNNGTTVKFSYDELGHLTQIGDSKGRAVELSFDIWGNLLKLGNNESKFTSPALFQEINSILLGYNESSAITNYSDSVKEAKVSYDYDNRLNSIKFVDGKNISLTYAPVDNHLYSVTNGEEETRYYFLENQLYATKNLSSDKSTKYIYIPGENICLAILRPDGKVQYPLGDVFSSITDLTDRKGQTTHSRAFNTLGMLKTSDILDIPTGYGGYLSLDNGNILFAKNGAVLLKAMRTFGTKAQQPGNVNLYFTNKLSFMGNMPLTNLNDNEIMENLGVNSRQ